MNEGGSSTQGPGLRGALAVALVAIWATGCTVGASEALSASGATGVGSDADGTDAATHGTTNGVEGTSTLDDGGPSGGAGSDSPRFDLGGDEADTAVDTSPPPCDNDDVPDTLEFDYVTSFETEIPDVQLQASFYDLDRDEITIMSFDGYAQRFHVDGQAIGDVFEVPDPVHIRLDGATYDPVSKRALLINQLCTLVEVEVVDSTTWNMVGHKDLGFDLSWCAGLALGLDNNLYIASYGTNELVVLDREAMGVEGRWNMMDEIGMNGIDGIAVIAGSENFLVMATIPPATAAIIDVDLQPPAIHAVVPTAPIGQSPLIGGAPMIPDAVLTICKNGHAWVCEAYDGSCFDYAPEGGDKDSCPCLIPG